MFQKKDPKSALMPIPSPSFINRSHLFITLFGNGYVFVIISKYVALFSITFNQQTKSRPTTYSKIQPP